MADTMANRRTQSPMTQEPAGSETPETGHNREHDHHCGHLMTVPGGKKSGIDCDVIAAVRHRHSRYR